MPYIKQDERQEPVQPRNVGTLNYAISQVVLKYRARQGENYQTYNDILGAIEGAKLELYRTLIGPYEASKALMNGSLPGQADIAWAAGFFDGEGNTNYTAQYRRDGSIRPKGRAQMSCSQKEPLLLLRLREAVGGIGYIRETRATKSRKFPIWTWQVARFDDLLHVVQTLWPWLGQPKREQSLSALIAYQQERDLDLGLPSSILDEWPEGNLFERAEDVGATWQLQGKENTHGQSTK